MIGRTHYEEDGVIKVKYSYWPFLLLATMVSGFLVYVNVDFYRLLHPYKFSDCDITQENYSHTLFWCDDTIIGNYTVCDYYRADANAEGCSQLSWIKSDCSSSDFAYSHACTHLLTPLLESN